MTVLDYTKLSEDAAQMVMTAAEEAASILDDIYDRDTESRDNAVQELCDEAGIANDPEVNGDEINDLIIENEDTLRVNYINDTYGEGVDNPLAEGELEEGDED
jgi:hypothetical protein